MCNFFVDCFFALVLISPKIIGSKSKKKENQNDKHIKNENKNRRNSGRENRENDTVEIENK